MLSILCIDESGYSHSLWRLIGLVSALLTCRLITELNGKNRTEWSSSFGAELNFRERKCKNKHLSWCQSEQSENAWWDSVCNHTSVCLKQHGCSVISVSHWYHTFCPTFTSSQMWLRCKLKKIEVMKWSWLIGHMVSGSIWLITACGPLFSGILCSQEAEFGLSLSFFLFQVSVICVRVPATCGSTEVRTDLPVWGKMASRLSPCFYTNTLTKRCKKGNLTHLTGPEQLFFTFFFIKVYILFYICGCFRRRVSSAQTCQTWLQSVRCCINFSKGNPIKLHQIILTCFHLALNQKQPMRLS